MSTTTGILLSIGALAIGCAAAFALLYLTKRAALAMFPELLLLRNSQEQRRALARAERNASTILLQMIVAIPAICLLLLGPCELSRGYPPLGGLVWAVPALPAGIFLTATVPALITRRMVHSRRRRELVARGIAVCPWCGCDLRGESEPICPKCGRGPTSCGPA
jgi:hypothetical protein